MDLILDTSFFFAEYPVSGDLMTTPAVISELVDLRSKCRYEALLAGGLCIREPSQESIKRVQAAASTAGDLEALSATDAGILALALDVGGLLLTDDFAVQNVALALGIPVRSLQQRKAKRRAWKFRCTGCGQMGEKPGICLVCGSQIKRTIK
ncbi:MAG TPA: nucleotide-binding protein [Methanoregulaceae archaeon]|nr:nucleotide-binding protein [Methanoregulaceae archaeon]HPD75329.1 nucleotide-binding protein [Methanoregulaceae archaeon]